MTRQGQKKKDFENTPFQKLTSLLSKKMIKSLPTVEEQKHLPSQKLPDAAEEDLLAQVMADVIPLQRRDVEFRQQPPPVVERKEEREVLEYLEALLQGEEDFDIEDSDEYTEGAVHGLDPRVLEQLRKGEFALQAHLDLHGVRVDEAQQLMLSFVEEHQRRGHRCVLVVHGRGLHSPGRVPVLKNRLLKWISRGMLRQKILAFATARPYDGGSGALYILLRSPA